MGYHHPVFSGALKFDDWQCPSLLIQLYRFSIEKILISRQKEFSVYSKNRIFLKNPVFLNNFMPEKNYVSDQWRIGMTDLPNFSSDCFIPQICLHTD